MHTGLCVMHTSTKASSSTAVHSNPIICKLPVTFRTL
jgi:hypothetical protein